MADIKNINITKRKKKQVLAKVKEMVAAALPSKKDYVEANGRRKTSIARVRLYEAAKNTINVNGLPVDEYFNLTAHADLIKEVFEISGDKKFAIVAFVKGSGQNAQAEAVRLGFSRALLKIDPDLRSALKDKGFLKRDPRAVERKKPGLKKARKAPAWVKR